MIAETARVLTAQVLLLMLLVSCYYGVASLAAASGLASAVRNGPLSDQIGCELLHGVGHLEDLADALRDQKHHAVVLILLHRRALLLHDILVQTD